MFRLREYYITLYRLLLVYIFYTIARILFYLYNVGLLQIEHVSDFINICYRGLRFDTAAILYVNMLFIVLSLIPVIINTRPIYQKILLYVYFTFNLLAYATNFLDFIYYRFSNFRLTIATIDEFKNETNGLSLFISFLSSYWHVFILFIGLSWLWIYLYNIIKVEKTSVKNKLPYFLTSIIVFLATVALIIGGIRGGYKTSTRPINLTDANNDVNNPIHAAMVLNTPFSIIRTINKNDFKRRDYFSNQEINQLIKPIKQYPVDRLEANPPNIVLLIIESFGREYIGSFNKRYDIPNYHGYTPFIDSLADHSLIFDNAFANGRKSIHAMSSVLAGIPSFKVAFTSSSFSNQPIESLVSCVQKKGYNTSFFHGADNGSMGFLGFGNILGIESYYGRTEFDNDEEFDGIWGIWDEPFLQYMSDILSTKETPFFSTIFTLSSHDPYVVPAQYKNIFPMGDIPIHQPVGYTDNALAQFFDKAKKTDWYENTIFVITADHTNQKYYTMYKEGINRTAVPILFYKPDNSLAKVDTSLAQHIDIYPTILDMIGYEDPFRSWGRSLIRDEDTPFVWTHTGNVFHFIMGDYICVFDGERSIGFYDIKDVGLKINLIGRKNQAMEEVEIVCKAYIQDYIDRIIDQAL